MGTDSGYRVAVIGGGIAGLTAAYELARQGFSVTLYEKEHVLGGLASSFPLDDGYLERYYHFICLNDQEYFQMLAELGLEGRLRWRLTKMGQYYQGAWYSFGYPWDVLFFRPWGWAEKLRFGLRIMQIKRQPAGAWRAIEHLTAEQWLVSTFGRRIYESIYQPLITLKFGPYAGRLSAAWMWARIHRLGKSRTRLLQLEKLGYLEGGTQTLVDALAERVRRLGGVLLTGRPVEAILLDGGRVQGLRYAGETIPYDAVLATIPTPYLAGMVHGAGQERLAGLNHIDSIGVTCLVLRLSQRFSPYFWTNISDSRIALAGVIEFSNLNAGACANGDHILYLPQYLPSDSPRYHLSDEEIFQEYLGYLRLMRPDFDASWVRAWWVFRDQYAQPICTTGFSQQVAGMVSPVRGLFITDSHQLYPDDRTVSNSIGLGRRAAAHIVSQRERDGGD